jgi:fatty aldehyde-generating acyl-ACP reductase
VATMGEGSEFRRHLQERVIQACTVAGREGATIAALGAFSSIVVVGMEDVVAERSGIAVTSGNTFTARLTIAGVERAAELIGVSLPDARVAMLGASGDIGRGVCRWLAQEVGHLTMAARNLPRLEAFAEELRVGARATVEVSPDNREAVREADIVIGAAISPTPIIQAEDVQPGAIVCDVGYPKNISVEMDKRPDVFSFLGGMSRPPFVLDFGYNVNLPSFDVLYGCLSEAIVLALEGRAEIFSAGRGNILPEKMDEIWELAQKHGFDVAPFHSGSRALDADDVARVRSAIRERHRRGAK